MTSSMLAQWLLVSLVLVASVVYLAHRQWPEWFALLRRSLVIWALRPVRPAWVRGVGRWLAPAPTVGGLLDGSCGGCSGCGGRTSE